jgi:lipid A 3-O-deacylase
VHPTMSFRSSPKRRRGGLTGPERDATALLAVLLLAASPALAGGTSVGVSSGQYGLRAGLPHEVGFQVDLRAPWQWGPVRPVMGVLAGSSGGAYLFTGLVLELPLPGGVQVSPGFAPGIVLSQGNRDLGSPIEFRSSIELSWLIASPVRVFVSFSHLSNGGLTRHNPGVETLMLGFQVAPSG